jgi:hypothetical protein
MHCFQMLLSKISLRRYTVACTSLDCSTALLQMRHLHDCFQREGQTLNPGASGYSSQAQRHGISDAIVCRGFRIEVGP